MLWVIHEREVFEAGCSGRTYRVLAKVHRFESGDAAMRRFSWSTSQLGQAEMKEGLRYQIDGIRHWFTTAHAMPSQAMMAAQGGFEMVLHRESEGEDFIKVWDVPPGREEIMTALDSGAEQAL